MHPSKHRSHVSLALLHLTLGRTEIRWLEEKPAELIALGFMERHYREPLSNAALARRAGVSERSLTRLFLRYQGVSPRQFLMQAGSRSRRSDAVQLSVSPKSPSRPASPTGPT